MSDRVLGDGIAILTAVAWSVAVILFRLASFHANALAITAVKSFLAFLSLAVLVLAQGGPLLPDFSVSELLLIAGSGILGITIGDVLFVASLQKIGAGLEAIVNATFVPLVAMTAYVMFGETLSILTVIGGTLVVAGVLLGAEVEQGLNLNRREAAWGIFLGIFSQFVMGLAVLMIRDLYRGGNVIWIIAFRFLVGNVSILALALLPRNRADLFQTLKNRPLLKLLVPAALFGPFLSTICWFYGYKLLPAGRAAIYNQLSTVGIVLLASWFLDEALTRRRIGAMVVAVVGAVIVGMSG